MDAVSEIKARISIEELVSHYVQLKKSGRHFKALCPFHNERTPSFYVSPEKQLAYCFACRKGGDHFTFIEEIEGLDFRGALQFLAERAGVNLPKISPKNKEKKSQRDRLITLHDKAAESFEEELWNTPDGKKVLSYLKKRGLKDEIIRKARLGFASESTSGLYTFLLKHDFTRSEILLAGLATARDMEESLCIDRFRMRLMFPIWNSTGSICAFAGRAVKEGDEPKYLNSPETPIFKKSGVLYGLSFARAHIREKDAVIVVEGYMDALSAHQASFQNVVACSGTAFTEEHLTLLSRITKNIVFAFDRDTAGKLAVNRAIQMAFAKELCINVAVWKSRAKDPDECIREDPAEFEKAVSNALPSQDYLLMSLEEQFDPSSAQGKKNIVSELLPFFSALTSPVELDVWLKQCASRLEISLQSLYDEVKRFKNKKRPLNLSARQAISNTSSKSWKLQEYLLGLLLTYPQYSSIANQILLPEDFEDSELQNIYRSLGTQYTQLSSDLTGEHRARAEILRMYIEMRYADSDLDFVKGEIDQTIQSILKQRFERKKRSLVSELRSATGDQKNRLIEEYQTLLAQENTLWQKN